MSQERWFRGGFDGRERPFDWRALAEAVGIAEEDARELYEAALRQAGDSRQWRRTAQRLYLELLDRAGAERPRPSPGKVTRPRPRAATRAACGGGRRSVRLRPAR